MVPKSGGGRSLWPFITWFSNTQFAKHHCMFALNFLRSNILCSSFQFNSIQKPGSANQRLVSAGRIQRGITRLIVIGFSLIAVKLPAVGFSKTSWSNFNMTVFICYTNQGIVLFWTLNSSLQLAQTMLLELPRIRQMLHLTPSRFGPQPIRTRWNLWKDKWSLFFRTLKWYSKL